MRLSRAVAAAVLVLVATAGVAATAIEGWRYFAPGWQYTGRLAPRNGGTLASLLAASIPLSPSASNSRDAIVLLYNTQCTVCRANMNNWFDLLSAVKARHPDLPTYALSLERGSLQRDYWGPITSRGIRLRQIRDVDAIVATLGTSSVPATAIIRDGRVRFAWAGYMGPIQRAQVLAALDAGVRQ